MKHPFYLSILLLFVNSSCKITQSGSSSPNTTNGVIKTFQVRNFSIEAGIQSNTSTPFGVTPVNLITLNGDPNIPSQQLNRAFIYFFSDNRAKSNPVYDQSNKTITVSYPIDRYSDFYDLLKGSKQNNQMLFSFYEGPNNGTIEVKLYYYDTIPIIVK